MQITPKRNVLNQIETTLIYVVWTALSEKK